ncbi:hypothetical protein [Halovivax cerinus]|uniref:Lipoprotein n=1 Tax=Halovivax cerinus TaxID=1487865 RepID=A0ABD5NJ19_9EURY|nr:hypothetical protein [Halovivax cerinus]
MHRSVSKRRLLVVIGLASLVLLAGCTNAGIDGAASPGGDESDTTDPGSNGGSADDLAEAEWQAFEYDRAATYTYDVYMEGDGDGTIVWDVSDVTADEATVSLSYDVGETSYETTVTGATTDIQSQLAFSPAGAFLMVSLFSPTIGYFEGETLAVGNEWSVQTPDGSMRTAVTGIDAYAGVECYTGSIEVDGAVVHESCISPEVGLAPYVAYYEAGETTVSMELVDFSTN